VSKKEKAQNAQEAPHEQERAAQRELLPLYAIISEESYLREQAVDRLKKRVAEESDLDFNYEHFEASAADEGTVLAALNTLPVLGPRRLVLISGVESAGADLIAALVAYAEDPAPTTVLALVGAKLLKSSRLYKVVDAHGGILARPTPKKYEIPAAVGDLFAMHGKTASPEVRKLVAVTVGTNLDALNAAVGKVATFVGERTEVTREDVEAVVDVSAETQIWQLGTAILERDGASALRLYQELLGQNETLARIVANAAYTTNDLLVVRSLLDAGETSSSHIISVVSKPDWLVKRTIAGAQHYTGEELRTAYIELAEVASLIPTAADSTLAFEQWLIRTLKGGQTSK